jgi:hypothetical protein
MLFAKMLGGAFKILFSKNLFARFSCLVYKRSHNLIVEHQSSCGRIQEQFAKQNNEINRGKRKNRN